MGCEWAGANEKVCKGRCDVAPTTRVPQAQPAPVHIDGMGRCEQQKRCEWGSVNGAGGGCEWAGVHVLECC